MFNIKYENLTPFGLFLAHKINKIVAYWPFVLKSHYNKMLRQLIDLEISHHNLFNVYYQMCERESNNFALPKVKFSEKVIDDPPSIRYSIDSLSLNYVVHERNMLYHNHQAKEKIIEYLQKKFARELAERYVNAQQ